LWRVLFEKRRRAPLTMLPTAPCAIATLDAYAALGEVLFRLNKMQVKGRVVVG
jgi:hypothetical protein